MMASFSTSHFSLRPRTCPLPDVRCSPAEAGWAVERASFGRSMTFLHALSHSLVPSQLLVHSAIDCSSEILTGFSSSPSPTSESSIISSVTASLAAWLAMAAGSLSSPSSSLAAPGFPATRPGCAASNLASSLCISECSAAWSKPSMSSSVTPSLASFLCSASDFFSCAASTCDSGGFLASYWLMLASSFWSSASGPVGGICDSICCRCATASSYFAHCVPFHVLLPTPLLKVPPHFLFIS
mmetsp:Transcript_7439/g.14475  ORF Transcript_7439/g.14475 Transcript_7439/m.14475 type:complete len:241 (-) Transcript_7439:228-950(-)